MSLMNLASLAQKWQLEIHSSEDDEEVLQKMIQVERLKFDSTSINQFLNRSLSEIRNDGFLLANLDSLHWDSTNDVVQAFIYVGKKYSWSNVSFRVANGDIDALARIGVDKWAGGNMPPGEFENIFRDIIEYSENSGYPFASVTWDSVRLDGDYLNGSLTYDSGPLITYDSIHIEGDLDIKREFLASYLDIHYGKPFRQARIDDIEARLVALPYLDLADAPVITFQNEEARLLLKLRKLFLFYKFPL